jgi:hypothetical protein
MTGYVAEMAILPRVISAEEIERRLMEESKNLLAELVHEQKEEVIEV